MTKINWEWIKFLPNGPVIIGALSVLIAAMLGAWVTYYFASKLEDKKGLKLAQNNARIIRAHLVSLISEAGDFKQQALDRLAKKISIKQLSLEDDQFRNLLISGTQDFIVTQNFLEIDASIVSSFASYCDNVEPIFLQLKVAQQEIILLRDLKLRFNLLKKMLMQEIEPQNVPEKQGVYFMLDKLCLHLKDWSELAARAETRIRNITENFQKEINKTPLKIAEIKIGPMLSLDKILSDFVTD